MSSKNERGNVNFSTRLLVFLFSVAAFEGVLGNFLSLSLLHIFLKKKTDRGFDMNATAYKRYLPYQFRDGKVFYPCPLCHRGDVQAEIERERKQRVLGGLVIEFETGIASCSACATPQSLHLRREYDYEDGTVEETIEVVYRDFEALCWKIGYQRKRTFKTEKFPEFSLPEVAGDEG